MSEMVRWIVEHFNEVPPTPALVIDATKHNAVVFLSNRIHPTAPNKPYLALRDEIVATYLQEAK